MYKEQSMKRRASSVSLGLVVAALGGAPAAFAQLCPERDLKSDFSLYVVYDSDYVNCDKEWACVSAAAVVSDKFVCGSYASYCNVSDWESECNGKNITKADPEDASCPNFDVCHWGAHAEIYAMQPDGVNETRDAYGVSWVSTCGTPCFGGCHYPTGVYWASTYLNMYDLSFTWKTGQHPPYEYWTVRVDGFIPDTMAAGTHEPKLRRAGFALYNWSTSTSAVLWQADDRTASQGFAYNPNDPNHPGGAWMCQLSVTDDVPAYPRIVLMPVNFNDALYDVTGYLAQDTEGRFNQADVTALNGQLGSTVPGLLARYDQNGDGTIDADDVAYLQRLVDLELDSGVFGDVNRDGEADCDDLQALLAAEGAELGDAAYEVTLDYDLDGVIDEADIAQLRENVCVFKRGDMNCDGNVNFADINPMVAAIQGKAVYQAAYPDCWWLNGDLNCDWAVNFADATLMVSCIQNAGCDCQYP